jgi:hypothetical protein
VIFTPGKNFHLFISRHILHQHWYTCPIALRVRQNPQHASLLTVVSAISAPPFQPLRHQWNVYHPAVNSFTRQTLPTINKKHFFTNILFTGSFCPQTSAQQNAALRYYTPQIRSPFGLLKQVSEHAHTCLLPRLSRSWTVLLPSDTHRKPITSIAAVLLPLVTYLLTLTRTIGLHIEALHVLSYKTSHDTSPQSRDYWRWRGESDWETIDIARLLGFIMYSTAAKKRECQEQTDKCGKSWKKWKTGCNLPSARFLRDSNRWLGTCKCWHRVCYL